jgi:hypothetical protein
MGSGHWPGMRHTSAPPVPLLKKPSGKSDRRPADSAGVNGPTEGRISGPTMQKKLFWIFAIVFAVGILRPSFR